MAVTHDLSVAGGDSTGSALFPWSITIPTGLVDSLLVVGMNADPVPASGVALGFGGTPLSELGTALQDSVGPNHNSIWYILSPAAGTYQIAVPGTSDKGGFGALFTGVDQTTPFGAEVNTGAPGVAGPVSLGLTVPAGGLAIDCATFTNGFSGTPVPSAGQTLFTDCPTTPTTTNHLVSGTFKSATGATTMGWAYSGSGTALSILVRAVTLNPAAGSVVSNIIIPRRRRR